MDTFLEKPRARKPDPRSEEDVVYSPTEERSDSPVIVVTPEPREEPLAEKGEEAPKKEEEGEKIVQVETELRTEEFAGQVDNLVPHPPSETTTTTEIVVRDVPAEQLEDETKEYTETTTFTEVEVVPTPSGNQTVVVASGQITTVVEVAETLESTLSAATPEPSVQTPEQTEPTAEPTPEPTSEPEPGSEPTFEPLEPVPEPDETTTEPESTAQAEPETDPSTESALDEPTQSSTESTQPTEPTQSTQPTEPTQSEPAQSTESQPESTPEATPSTELPAEPTQSTEPAHLPTESTITDTPAQSTEQSTTTNNDVEEHDDFVMVESPSQPHPAPQQPASDLLDDPVVVPHEEVPLVTEGVEGEEGEEIGYEPEFEPAFPDNAPAFDSTTANALVDNALPGSEPTTETNPDSST